MKSRSQHSVARRTAVTLAALGLLAVGAATARAQSTYTWNASGTVSWQTASNWTPARTSPATDDILVFNNGATTTATSIPPQTIGQLRVSGNTTVNLQALPNFFGVGLTIAGGTGPDLSVTPGSALNVTGTTQLRIRLLAGATGAVSGNMTFSGAAHNLDAADASAIQFGGNARFTQGAGCTGNVFNNAGAANVIVFGPGTTFVFAASGGADPFGFAQPSSKVVFQTGSLYRQAVATAPSLSGRTYADFELNVAASVLGTGAAALGIDHLTVSLGTLTLGMTGPFHLKGNVVVASGARLNLSPASNATVTLDGPAVQTITVDGAFSSNERESFDIDNPNGIQVANSITLGGNFLSTGSVSALHFTHGLIHLGANVLTIGPTTGVTGASQATGWVDGKLKRTVTIAKGAGSQSWPVGDVSTYAPIDFSTSDGAGGIVLTGWTTPGEHPDVGASGIDAARDVNRWYTLARNSGTFSGTVELTFHFAASDVDGGADTGDFYGVRHDPTLWTPLIPGTRTSTSTQATGVTDFGEFAIGETGLHVLTATAGPGGSIAPSGSLLVTEGGSQSYDIAPADKCHVIADVTVDDVSVGAVSTYAFSNVTADHTIAATFSALGPFTITPSAAGAGTVYPSAPVSVSCGDAYTFTINASQCGTAVDVLVDGVSIGPVVNYTFTDVQTNHTIHAIFNQVPPFTITATAGPGGAVTPAGSVQFDCGSDPSFSIRPDSCFAITDVRVDDVSVGPVTDYTFHNLHADHTLAASFAPIMPVITAGAGAGGSISPSGPVDVPCDGSQTFTITPSDGCHPIQDVKVDGVSVGPVSSYTFTAVRSAHQIEASFANGTFTITAGTVGSGTMTPSGVVIVACGASQSFTIDDIGCGPIAEVSIDNVSMGPIAGYTFTDVHANHTIVASFATDSFHLDVNIQGEGTVSLSPQVPDNRYACGTTVTLMATASPNWSFQSWVGDFSGTSTTLEVTLAHDSKVTAVFGGPFAGVVQPTIHEFRLARVTPNPGAGPLRIEWELPRESRVRLSVLDVQGRELAVPTDGTFQAGRHETTWSGQSDQGSAPAGIYFVRGQALGKELTRRFVRIR